MNENSKSVNEQHVGDKRGEIILEIIPREKFKLGESH